MLMSFMIVEACNVFSFGVASLLSHETNMIWMCATLVEQFDIYRKKKSKQNDIETLDGLNRGILSNYRILEGGGV